MNPTVLAALIGLVGTVFTAAAAIVTQIIINKRNREKQSAEREEERKKAAIAEALKGEHLEQRLKNIEEKLDTHNGYAEKISDVNANIVSMKTDIAYIKGKMEKE